MSTRRKKPQLKRSASKPRLQAVDWLRNQATTYWRSSWLHKATMVIILLAGLTVGTMYGIARWYIWQERGKPLELGASFTAEYAAALGLDPHQTLLAMLNDLGVKHLRLMSYWDQIEPAPGKYDFSELDWEFRAANATHATVTLTLGLRQPRWPECHAPSWVDTTKAPETWQPDLEQFIQQVVERYKDNPALKSYQLENEFFMTVFGKCTDFRRERLESEYRLVKYTDPTHPVIIARSNNAIGTPIYGPTPDEYGVSVYKRVWDQTITRRYLEYPFPAWFYAFLAGTEKILHGKDTMIHELQTEPWPPRNVFVPNASIAEQDKSMNAKMLKTRISYGEATGMKEIYLWGGEWWYWRLVKVHDPSLWNVAKTAMRTSH